MFPVFLFFLFLHIYITNSVTAPMMIVSSIVIRHLIKNSSGRIVITGSVSGLNNQSSLSNAILWNNTNNLSKYDEKPHRLFGSRTVRGYSNSPEANVAQLQLALLKSKAADGDSFVIVGRCADDIFRGMENFISIFIYADREARIKRVLERHPQLDEKQAIKKIERHDRNRAAYHNYFAKGGKWGDKANYDLCVNSTRLGLEGTVDFLCKYIEQRLGH